MRVEAPKFCRGDMHATLANQKQRALDAALALTPERVLAVPIEDLADELYPQFSVTPLRLLLEQRTSSGAKDIDVMIDGFTGNRVKVPGTRIEFRIPFTGDAVLFDVSATQRTLNPPRFEVNNGAVVIAYEGRAPLDRDQVKAFVDGLTESIERHIAWQQNDIEPWNVQLRADLPEWLKQRRAKVLADRDLDAFFEVPVVGRRDPSPSFAVDPPRRQRPLAVAPAQESPAFAPEPAISDEGFQAILDEIQSVTTAVQRLPKTFATMPEESLRDVLLVVLNNRFGQASGETFSRRGKTDIFIPYEGDERAVFIAECKWWKGAKAFQDAISQLLGYLTWRDTRAALIVFIKAGSPSDIAEKATGELQSHESFKRMRIVGGRETFTLTNRDDRQREIHLALVLVPVLA